MPTASNMRLIWRFQPWARTTRYQRSSGSGGASRAIKLRTWAGVVSSRTSIRARPSSSSIPPRSAAFCILRDRAIQPDHVLALHAVARMQEQLRPGAVVGEEQQPLRLLVQPADGIQPRSVPRLGRQQLHDRPIRVAVAHGRDDPGRLVQGPVGPPPNACRKRLAVDLDPLHLRVDLLADDGEASVDGDSPGTDQLLAATSRRRLRPRR